MAASDHMLATDSVACPRRLTFMNSSILPSGHSASTCQCSPSFKTTQKIGVRSVMFSSALQLLYGYFWPIAPDCKGGNESILLPNLYRLSKAQFLTMFNGDVVGRERQMDTRDDHLAILF
jgi:hypothetical protein